MKKLLTFSSCLEVLKKADFEKARNDEIYRMGIIEQFNFTLEVAWKALQETLKSHGVAAAETGSPREILQLGFKFGFIDDPEIRLLMLKKRNLAVHMYNSEEADILLEDIKERFIPAFCKLREVPEIKIKETSGD